MRIEKVVFTCDDCKCEIREGFAFVGGICTMKTGIFEKIAELSIDGEQHYCKPCFKAKLGLKERATKEAAV